MTKPMHTHIEQPNLTKGSIAVIGVGYVGIQLALLFSKKYPVTAFDISAERIEELRIGNSVCQELKVPPNAQLFFTNNLDDIANADIFLVAVPTPTIQEQPDLSLILSAMDEVAPYLKKNSIVVVASTLHPSSTEHQLIPILERGSGLKSGEDFYVGFCPERINPGDSAHTIKDTVQVVSGQNEAALAAIKALYESVLPGQVFAASSIQVAEATKLLENIQRDVNIALLNEYTEIMTALNIPIHDVLDACRTKWNFLPFSPGLVSGHCIPVDPYYLISHARTLGIKTPLISTAREINESFVDFITQIVAKQLEYQHINIKNAIIVILGITIKADVPDTRHSLSLKLYESIISKGASVYINDPIARHLPDTIANTDWNALPDCNVMILTKNHNDFKQRGFNLLCEKLSTNGSFIDLSGEYHSNECNRNDIHYWSV